MKTRRTFLCSILSIFILAACSKPSGAGADPDVDYYTCSMHPSVHLHDPAAKCPICSMDLVPVRKTGAIQAKNDTPELTEFRVPVERQ